MSDAPDEDMPAEMPTTAATENDEATQSAKKLSAPEPPRWRFVKEAKKTAGYSSFAAGMMVKGLSAEELGAKQRKQLSNSLQKFDNEQVKVGKESSPRNIGKLRLKEDDDEVVEETYESEVTFNCFRKKGEDSDAVEREDAVNDEEEAIDEEVAIPKKETLESKSRGGVLAAMLARSAARKTEADRVVVDCSEAEQVNDPRHVSTDTVDEATPEVEIAKVEAAPAADEEEKQAVEEELELTKHVDDSQSSIEQTEHEIEKTLMVMVRKWALFILLLVVVAIVATILGILLGGGKSEEDVVINEEGNNATLIRDSSKLTYTWVQDGPAIVGERSGDELGNSVAFSADGNTLAIGAPGANDDRHGYVKIYRRDCNVWRQLADTIEGRERGDIFGWSVSLSEDGNTVAIGAPGFWSNLDRPGYVNVYHYSQAEDGIDSSWQQLGQTLEGAADGDQAGMSISLSADGHTLAIGANNNGDNVSYSGHVRVYYYAEGSGWKRLGQTIYGDAVGDWFGWSLDLSSDGSILVAGALFNSEKGDQAGQVKVYKWDESTFMYEQLDTLYGESAGDSVGYSVALSSNGAILAIGAPGNWDEGGKTGYAKVYQIVSDGDGSTMRLLGQEIQGKATGDLFGASVSLSSEGNVVAVGSNGSDEKGLSSGSVRVYQIMDGGWEQVGQTMLGTGAGDQSGWAVSLSEDGMSVAIGSVWNSDNGDSSGHVRVFNAQAQNNVEQTLPCG